MTCNTQNTASVRSATSKGDITSPKALTYAGIGSRETPRNILRVMENIAYVLAPHAILRSGGAVGADTAFEFGAKTAYGKWEIYLPWQGYKGRRDSAILEPSPEAFQIAEHYHPAWDRCSEVARALHARNSHIVLGKWLDDPVELVICWTPGAKGGGGTGQALRIARDRCIEVWDLADPEQLALAIDSVAQ